MRFQFGQNWTAYSSRALNAERIGVARRDFRELLPESELRGARFLDVGFGQGLALCLAQEAGAKVLGVDLDEDNKKALETTSSQFPELRLPPVRFGSILDPAMVEELAAQGPYDVVHSWGVLHHTGDMDRAIGHCAALVREGGLLALAIYNKHWSNNAWLAIKWLYNASPPILQRLFIFGLYPTIAAAKALVTRKNPFAKDRGMDFYHDVVDWVGGYPYEWESADGMKTRLEALGFSVEKLIPATVPTGCHQYLFRKQPIVAQQL